MRAMSRNFAGLGSSSYAVCCGNACRPLSGLGLFYGCSPRHLRAGLVNAVAAATGAGSYTPWKMAFNHVSG